MINISNEEKSVPSGKNNLTTIIAVGVIVGAIGFFGGMKYQDYKISKTRNNLAGQFRQGLNPNASGQNRSTNGNRFVEGAANGEIVNMDDKSITVKMQDGSTKIVILSDKTTFNKSAEGSKSDLKTGDTVISFGTPNSDGSVTAQNIQINPVFRGFGGQNGSPSPTK